MGKLATPVSDARRALADARQIEQASIKAFEDMVARRTAAATELDEADRALRMSAGAMGAGGPDPDFNAATDRVAVLKSRLETIGAQFIPEAERNRDAATAAVAHATCRVAYAEAEELANEVARELVEQYPPLLETFERLKSRVALASDLVEKANANRPAGAPYLSDPEGRIRDQNAHEGRSVSETRVELWTFAGSGAVLSDELAATVLDQGGGKGWLPNAGVGATSRATTEVVLRPFLRREIERPMTYRGGPRLATVDLGPLSVAVPAVTSVEHEPLD